MKILTLFLSVVVFNGCATRVFIGVNSNSGSPLSARSSGSETFDCAGKTFDVGHPDKTINASQEFAFYKGRIVQKLRSKGLILDADDPELLVVITYAIAGGRYGLSVENKGERNSRLGLANSNSKKNTEPNAFRPKPKVEAPKVDSEKNPLIKTKSWLAGLKNSTYIIPVYGGVGPKSSSYNSYSEYTRRLDIEIFDRKSLESGNIKMVYDVHASSTGATQDLASVMPYLIEAVLRVFPDKNAYRSFEMGLGEVER